MVCNFVDYGKAIRIILLPLFFFSAFHSILPAGALQHFGFKPMAVRLEGTESSVFHLQTDGSVTSVLLEHANGVNYPLIPNGGGLFTLTLNHSLLIYGYTAEKYNHNLLGKLHIYQGGVELGPYMVTINIVDNQIPSVPLQTVNSELRKGPHVVHLILPNLNPADPDPAVILQHFYQYFPDNFDFISLLSVPERYENRYYVALQNPVQGIGKAVFNNSLYFGSQGRLLGYINYPITGYFDLAQQAALHEIGHQWINYIAGPKLPLLQGITPHWPISSMARGIMGYQCCGMLEGLDFPYDFQNLGGGNYRLSNQTGNSTYSDMDLYLMGLMPADQVGPNFVFPNQNQALCHGCTLTGAQPFQAADIIAAYGARVPAYAAAPKVFRMAAVVAGSTPLSDTELLFLDAFAARGSLTTPVGYTSGYSSGTALPFYLATNGRGCLLTALESDGLCAALSSTTTSLPTTSSTSSSTTLAGTSSSSSTSTVRPTTTTTQATTTSSTTLPPTTTSTLGVVTTTTRRPSTTTLAITTSSTSTLIATTTSSTSSMQTSTTTTAHPIPTLTTTTVLRPTSTLRPTTTLPSSYRLYLPEVVRYPSSHP